MESQSQKLVFFLLSVIMFALPVYAQENEVPQPQFETTANHTPRDTVKRLLVAISEQSEPSLKDNFDTRPSRQLSNGNINTVVKAFPALLDRYGSLLPIGIISNREMGSEESSLSAQYEQIGQIKIRSRSIPILLHRIDDQGVNRWLVSQQTIAALLAVSGDVQTPLINQILPANSVDKLWQGAPLGQWLSMPFLLLFSILVGTLTTKLMRRMSDVNKTSLRSVVFSALAVPVGIVISVITFLLIERYFGISILIRQSFSVLTVSALWIALFIFLWAFIDRASAQGETRLREKNKVASLSLVVFFRASAKVAILVLAVIFVLDSNGVDVTTGLAALGIGGIALALGAQKAIENIVGSIVIVVDQPFRVGDFCQIGDMLGTVENIGLRSTRIRTLADTLVTYPNGELSTQRVENYTLRRKFLMRTTLNLRYETPTEDLEQLLVELRDALKNNKVVANDGMRVRFIGYGSASLDVEVFAYVKAKTFDEFLAKQESILLSMSHSVEANNSGFAYPSQTVYLAKDKAPI